MDLRPSRSSPFPGRKIVLGRPNFRPWLRPCTLPTRAHNDPFPVYQDTPPLLLPQPFIFLEKPSFNGSTEGMNWRILVSFPIRIPLTLSLLRVFSSISHNRISIGPCFVGYLRCYLTAGYFSKIINAFIMSMLFLLICASPIALCVLTDCLVYQF